MTNALCRFVRYGFLILASRESAQRRFRPVADAKWVATIFSLVSIAWLVLVTATGVTAQVTAEPRDEPSSPRPRFDFGLLVGHALLPDSAGGYIGTSRIYVGYSESEPQNLTERFHVQIREKGRSRPILGAVAELRLTQVLGLEAAFLSRSTRETVHGVTYDDHAGLNYDGTPSGEDSWELPISVKYRFKAKRLRPFVGAGIAFRIPDYGITKARAITSQFGIEVRCSRRWKISPQIRYNYWLLPDWLSSAPIGVKRNQLHVLIGFSFGI